MLQPFTPTFFRRLQQLRIQTRRAFLGSRQGMHTSHRRGHGLEFADYRLYAPGDDFRHIDWGVLARTDRLYVRQFRDEQDLNVIFLIDGSRSMAFPENSTGNDGDTVSKFQMARNLALALGYVALAGGDTVTFSVLGQRSTPRYRGPKALAKATRELNAMSPQGSINFTDEIRAAVALHRIPGKCFLLSDLLAPAEEITEAIDLLRARNFEIAVLQVLSPDEISLNVDLRGATAVDSETGETAELLLGRGSQKEYADLLSAHLESIEKYCLSSGITHLVVPSNESISDVVLTRLPELGLLK